MRSARSARATCSPAPTSTSAICGGLLHRRLDAVDARARRRSARRSRRCRRARSRARGRRPGRAAARPRRAAGEPVDDVVGDAVALLLAEDEVARERRRARDSRRAGRAAAASRAGRCGRTPRTGSRSLHVGCAAEAAPSVTEGTHRRARAPRRVHESFTARFTGRVTGRRAAPRRCSADHVGGERQDEDVLRVGALEIRPPRASCSPPAGALTLSVREFGLLVALARRAGADRARARTSTRRSGAAPLRAGDRSVDVYVHKLRVKLEEALPGWRFIHTHVGFGYRFDAGAFTRFSQPAHSSVTGCARADASLAAPTIDQRRTTCEVTNSRSPPRAAGVAGVGVAACGSDDSSSSTQRLAAAARALARAARSTAPARPSRRPVYSEWAARFKDQGRHHGQLPGHRLGRRHRAVHRRHRRLRRHRRGDEADEEVAAAKKKGDAGPRPDRARRGHGLLQRLRRRQGPQARRRDDRRHLPRQDQEVERPGDRQAEPGAKLPDTDITVCHRSDESGTTKNFTDVPRRLLARVEERPGVDKTVKWPTGTGAKGNDGVAGLRQADRRRGRLRRAGLRAAEQLHHRRGQEQVGQLRRADARVDLGGRRGRRGPGRPALQHDQRAGRARPTRSPRRRSCSSTRTRARPGVSAEDKAQARQGLARTTRSATARTSRPGAAVRAAARPRSRPRPRPRSTACSATAGGAAQGRTLHRSNGGRQMTVDRARGGRSRPRAVAAARRPTRPLQVDPDRAGGAASSC